jgi:hypothetical protein
MALGRGEYPKLSTPQNGGDFDKCGGDIDWGDLIRYLNFDPTCTFNTTMCE